MKNQYSAIIKKGGFSLVELMVALTLGLILLGGVLAVYMAQTNNYKTAGAQGAIQDEENAIAALVTPLVRSAGFMGCSGTASVLSTLGAGAPPPLGAQSTSKSMIQGYDYAGTAGAGSAYTIAVDNPPDDGMVAHWAPNLDPSFVASGASVAPGSDVLVVFGATLQGKPVGVYPTPNAHSVSMVVNDASGFQAGQFGAISDCAKSALFQVSTPMSAPPNGTPGAITIIPALGVAFSPGAQVIPIQQNAFFVAYGQGGESVLMKATLQATRTGTFSWSTSGNPAVTGVPLVSGVETMQVLYGIGANGVVTQYLPASAVTQANWPNIYVIRMGFLLEGRPGSGSIGQPTTFDVLGTTITVPADTRLRHVFEMTINVRNAS